MILWKMNGRQIILIKQMFAGYSGVVHMRPFYHLQMQLTALIAIRINLTTNTSLSDFVWWVSLLVKWTVAGDGGLLLEIVEVLRSFYNSPTSNRSRNCWMLNTAMP